MYAFHDSIKYYKSKYLLDSKHKFLTMKWTLSILSEMEKIMFRIDTIN